MSGFKPANFGMYGTLDRALQSSLAFEHESLTSKSITVYLYLGSRVNATPSITDVQDSILLESRDRAYGYDNPISLNVYIQPLPENVVDFSNLGIINPLGNEQIFRVHVDSFAVDGLGRYLIPGDVLEVPFWLQDGYPTRFSVSEVDRKMAFENFYVTVTGVRLDDSSETTEILNQRLMTMLTTEQNAMDAITAGQVPVGGITEIQTSLSALQITNAGTGYVTAPTVNIIGGIGSGATASATVAGGQVTALTISAGGTGYDLPPIILISGDGAGATATAEVTAGAVTGYVMVDKGTGYSTASVAFSTVFTQATAVAFVADGAVSVINLTNSGLHYTSIPDVGFSGGSGSGAVAVAVISGAGTVTNPTAVPPPAYTPQITDPAQESFLDDIDSLNF